MKQDEFDERVRQHKIWENDENTGKRLSLISEDLSFIDFSKLNISHAIFNNCKFDSAYLYDCKFSHAVMNNSSFEDAILEDSSFHLVAFVGSNFKNTDLEDTFFEACDLTNANLTGARMFGANFSNSILDSTALSIFQYERSQAFHMSGMITIEYTHERAEYWLECYQDVLSKYDYTDKQIEKYGEFIKICAKS